MNALTPEQKASLLEAAKPLMKWLNENCHPMIQAQVDQTQIELLEGQHIEVIHEFVKD